MYACVHFNADTNVQNTYNTGKVNGGLTDVSSYHELLRIPNGKRIWFW